MFIGWFISVLLSGRQIGGSCGPDDVREVLRRTSIWPTPGLSM
jgi:hypothetical protein